MSQNSSSSLFKRIFSSTIVRLLTRGFSFLLNLYIVRVVHPEIFGKVANLQLAQVTVSALILEPLRTFVMRAGVIGFSPQKKIAFPSIIRFLYFFGLILFGLYLAIWYVFLRPANVTGYDYNHLDIFYLLSSLIDFMNEPFFICAQSFHLLKGILISEAVSQIIRTVLVAVLIRGNDNDVLSFTFSHVMGSLTNLITFMLYYFFLLRKNKKVKQAVTSNTPPESIVFPFDSVFDFFPSFSKKTYTSSPIKKKNISVAATAEEGRGQSSSNQVKKSAGRGNEVDGVGVGNGREGKVKEITQQGRGGGGGEGGENKLSLPESESVSESAPFIPWVLFSADFRFILLDAGLRYILGFGERVVMSKVLDAFELGLFFQSRATTDLIVWILLMPAEVRVFESVSIAKRKSDEEEDTEMQKEKKGSVDRYVVKERIGGASKEKARAVVREEKGEKGKDTEGGGRKNGRVIVDIDDEIEMIFPEEQNTNNRNNNSNNRVNRSNSSTLAPFTQTSSSSSSSSSSPSSSSSSSFSSSSPKSSSPSSSPPPSSKPISPSSSTSSSSTSSSSTLSSSSSSSPSLSSKSSSSFSSSPPSSMKSSPSSSPPPCKQTSPSSSPPSSSSKQSLPSSKSSLPSSSSSSSTRSSSSASLPSSPSFSSRMSLHSLVTASIRYSIYIGLCFCPYLCSLAPHLVYFTKGAAWLPTKTPLLEGLFVASILLMSMNGIAEAIVRAVATTSLFFANNIIMSLESAFYVGTCILMGILRYTGLDGGRDVVDAGGGGGGGESSSSSVTDSIGAGQTHIGGIGSEHYLMLACINFCLRISIAIVMVYISLSRMKRKEEEIKIEKSRKGKGQKEKVVKRLDFSDDELSLVPLPLSSSLSSSSASSPSSSFSSSTSRKPSSSSSSSSSTPRSLTSSSSSSSSSISSSSFRLLSIFPPLPVLLLALFSLLLFLALRLFVFPVLLQAKQYFSTGSVSALYGVLIESLYVAVVVAMWGLYVLSIFLFEKNNDMKIFFRSG